MDMETPAPELATQRPPATVATSSATDLASKRANKSVESGVTADTELQHIQHVNTGGTDTRVSDAGNNPRNIDQSAVVLLPQDCDSSANEQSVADQSRSRDIFDERFMVLMNGFGETCNTNNVELALAIAVDPVLRQPLIFMKGNTYKLAKLTKETLEHLRALIVQELGG